MKAWQKFVDHLGDEMSAVMRWFLYCVAGYTWIIALFAPISEYCYVGPWKFYKLWQKLCFSLGMLVTGYGFFRFGRSFRTTEEKYLGVHAA